MWDRPSGQQVQEWRETCLRLASESPKCFNILLIQRALREVAETCGPDAAPEVMASHLLTIHVAVSVTIVYTGFDYHSATKDKHRVTRFIRRHVPRSARQDVVKVVQRQEEPELWYCRPLPHGRTLEAVGAWPDHVLFRTFMANSCLSLSLMMQVCAGIDPPVDTSYPISTS